MAEMVSQGVVELAFVRQRSHLVINNIIINIVSMSRPIMLPDA